MKINLNNSEKKKISFNILKRKNKFLLKKLIFSIISNILVLIFNLNIN
jgi:hypothetical protein